MAPIGSRRESFPVYAFLVEVEGLPDGYFRSCSGLKTEAEVVSVQAGGVNGFEHKLIGRTKLANIILTQGFAGPALWKKRDSFSGSDEEPIKRFNGRIVQLGPGGKKVHQWQFAKAWICKWEGPTFDATKNEISVETIEIAHEGLTLLKASASTGASKNPSTRGDTTKQSDKDAAAIQPASPPGIKPPTSDAETLKQAMDIVKKSRFARTEEGRKVVDKLTQLEKAGKIKFFQYPPEEARTRGSWDRELKVTNEFNRDPKMTASELVHEATHAVNKDEKPAARGLSTIDEEMRTNTNQLELYKEQRIGGLKDRELERRLKAQEQGSLREDVRKRYPKLIEHLPY